MEPLLGRVISYSNVYHYPVRAAVIETLPEGSRFLNYKLMPHNARSVIA